MAHYNRDWDEMGQSIQNIVDRAVNSHDYQRLNQTIRQAVDRAVNIGGKVIREAADGAFTPPRTGASYVQRTTDVRLYGSAFGKSFGSIVKILFGSFLSLFSCLALLGGLISEEPITNYLDTVFFILLMLAGGVWLLYSGATTLELVRRFKIYRRILGQNTHCDLRLLSSSVNKSISFIRKDLQRMFKKQLFREGHMDKEQTCLITSHETFRYYEQSRLALEQRQRQAAAQAQNTQPVQNHATTKDPQIQEVLDRGDAFITQIRKCNDAIPGEEISEKIYRMELIVQRIFDRAEAHPEIIPDLKKLMDYYLPMTVKLLDAYADMDSQPIQGETIEASKREIEDSLDTLNLAFEKLLDSIFKDTAIDVSSDISVLNTLLAQEGLTEDDFPQLNTQS